jgi:hypothetical protein
MTAKSIAGGGGSLFERRMLWATYSSGAIPISVRIEPQTFLRTVHLLTAPSPREKAALMGSGRSLCRLGQARQNPWETTMAESASIMELHAMLVDACKGYDEASGSFCWSIARGETSLLARKGGPFPRGSCLSSRKSTGVKRTNRTKQGCAPDRSGKRLFSASDHRAKSPLFDLTNDSRWHFDLKILPAKPIAVCNTPPGKKIASFVQPRPLEVVIQGHTDLTR